MGGSTKLGRARGAAKVGRPLQLPRRVRPPPLPPAACSAPLSLSLPAGLLRPRTPFVVPPKGRELHGMDTGPREARVPGASLRMEASRRKIKRPQRVARHASTVLNDAAGVIDGGGERAAANLRKAPRGAGRQGKWWNCMCEVKGCTTRPSFGVELKIPRWCANHAPEGAWDVRSKKCEVAGCVTRPNFGVEPKKPRWCAAHAPVIAWNVVSKKCESVGCTKIPSFGFEPRKPRWCVTHAPPKSWNVTKKMTQERHMQKGTKPLKARGGDRGAGKLSPETSPALAARVDALASAAAGVYELMEGLLADVRALQHEVAAAQNQKPRRLEP